MGNEEKIVILVSIVMITYDHEKFIEEAINGVFTQQTKFPVELIIANDCSPDNTDEIVSDFIQKAPSNFKVKYTRHEKNLGMNPNFSWAAEQATGKYIAICEGDDYWTDIFKLQKQVDFLESNLNYGLVHTNYVIKNEIDNTFKTDNFGEISKYKNEEEKYLFDGKLRTLTVFFRSEYSTDFLELLKNPLFKNFPLGDRILFSLIASKSKIKFLPEVTGVYRISNNESASNFNSIRQYFEFDLKVAHLNKNLIKYLNIKNDKYIKHIKNRIYFLEFCLLLINKKYKRSLAKIPNLRITFNEFKGILLILSK